MHDEQKRIYRAMSPGRKLELAAQMQTSARELKAATLRSLHPDWSEETIRQRVKEAFLYAAS
jgi:hypothetical protein